MSNLIPPLLSSSPPPIVAPLEEEDDDEFGDFRAAADSYDCDDFSLPPSPHKSPEKELKTDCSKVNLDINSNNSHKVSSTTEMPTQDQNGLLSEELDKDFQDRRKNSIEVINDLKTCEIVVNCSDSQSETSPTIFDIHKEEVISNVDAVNELHEQIVDKANDELSCELSRDQNHKIQAHSDILDDFSDLQCVAPSPVTKCEEFETTVVTSIDTVSDQVDNQGQSDFNSFSNEENLFDAFSESTQEKTNNSDELSELNEIKSEDDGIDEINSEITDGDEEKDDKFDNSSKEINDGNLSESSLSLKVSDTKVSDDDFGDFENHFVNDVVDDPQDAALEDEFDDFVNPLPSSSIPEQPDDDFGDFESSEFGDFESESSEKPVLLEIDVKNAVDKSEIILKEIFPSVKEEVGEYEHFDGTNRNTIFEELKDVTETNALIYQWSKSNSQKMFLKSLNIDTRNILYGPAWNSSMPRFAANLGLTPLEPVKTEILTPTPLQNISSPSISSQKNNSDIPSAQFDWSGSGLINPLDYLEQLVASLDIPSTTNPTSNKSPSPSNELLDEWDLWLQSTSTELPGNVTEDSSQPQIQTDLLPSPPDKPVSIPTLFDAVETVPEEPPSASQIETNIELPKLSSQLEDFSPFHSPKLIPLRETHIANELNDFMNKPGWLQPTILTPDLPRKETVTDPGDEDEFDDFQMVLPEENKPQVIESEVKLDTVSLPDLNEFEVNIEGPVLQTSHKQEHIFPLSCGPNDSPVQKQPNNKNDDDEFTEFHSSLPQADILKPMQPVPLEPLKPTIQYSAPVSQINWPEPGVTEDDIKNIELTYSRKSEPKFEKTKSEVSQENSLEDDEWTDFVSVTNPVKSVLPERTSTPDLPLSVLNLNNVHAPKQPIPVITPSGLVQTKLSSNITLQPKSVVQTKVQPNLFKPPSSQFQPSIISNQFAANFFPISNNGANLPSSTRGQGQDDDDDWSDFVSSQPPPQVNGYSQKSTLNQGKPPQINWTNATTNIIMNPTHFETFQSYVPPQNKKSSAVPTRNAIPSISAMPDLDFIAPKNRTSKK